MTVSFYENSGALVKRALETLTHILKRAEEHATANGTNADDLLQARLADDMYPLARQIGFVAVLSHMAFCRAAGQAPPPFDPTKTMKTMAECHGLIAQVQTALDAIDPAVFEENAAKIVPLQMGGQDFEAPATGYFQGFALPNIFFHLQTAYCILRHKGVPLGKNDYLISFAQVLTKLPSEEKSS